MRDGATIASGFARVAADALAGVPLELRPEADPFGVLAPPARQRAAFEEYRRADAGTVVQAKALNVEPNSIDFS